MVYELIVFRGNHQAVDDQLCCSLLGTEHLLHKSRFTRAFTQGLKFRASEVMAHQSSDPSGAGASRMTWMKEVTWKARV
jgi:hypothetical protein